MDKKLLKYMLDKLEDDDSDGVLNWIRKRTKIQTVDHATLYQKVELLWYN